MLVFIAGAISTGALVAMNNDDRKSSARPLANLPTVLAVAGATSSRSIVEAIEMCSMSAFAPAFHWSVMTSRRVIASNVSGPTNCVADRVITATTSCPFFWSPRAISTAL